MQLWKQREGWEAEDSPVERPEKSLHGGGWEPGLSSGLDGREVQETRRVQLVALGDRLDTRGKEAQGPEGILGSCLGKEMDRFPLFSKVRTSAWAKW